MRHEINSSGGTSHGHSEELRWIFSTRMQRQTVAPCAHHDIRLPRQRPTAPQTHKKYTKTTPLPETRRPSQSNNSPLELSPSSKSGGGRQRHHGPRGSLTGRSRCSRCCLHRCARRCRRDLHLRRYVLGPAQQLPATQSGGSGLFNLGCGGPCCTNARGYTSLETGALSLQAYNTVCMRSKMAFQIYIATNTTAIFYTPFHTPRDTKVSGT